MADPTLIIILLELNIGCTLPSDAQPLDIPVLGIFPMYTISNITVCMEELFSWFKDCANKNK